MSLIKDAIYDCIVTFSFGLVTNSNDINSKLALIANNLELDIPIICPAQIWYYLEDFPCNGDCISILKRNPTELATGGSEIIEVAVTMAITNHWQNVLVVSHPSSSSSIIHQFNQYKLAAHVVDCSSVVK